MDSVATAVRWRLATSRASLGLVLKGITGGSLCAALESPALSSFGAGDTARGGGAVCGPAGLLRFSKRALNDETGFWTRVKQDAALRAREYSLRWMSHRARYCLRAPCWAMLFSSGIRAVVPITPAAADRVRHKGIGIGKGSSWQCRRARGLTSPELELLPDEAKMESTRTGGDTLDTKREALPGWGGQSGLLEVDMGRAGCRQATILRTRVLRRWCGVAFWQLMRINIPRRRCPRHRLYLSGTLRRACPAAAVFSRWENAPCSTFLFFFFEDDPPRAMYRYVLGNWMGNLVFSTANRAAPIPSAYGRFNSFSYD